MCRDDKANAKKVGEVISKDPSFVAKLLNVANSSFYGGDDKGNGSGIQTEAMAFDDCEQSAEFLLPPCSTMLFKWDGRG